VNWVCSDALDPRFLAYALQAEGDHLLDFGKGTTHTTIYFPAVLAFHACLAPIAEQRRIVEAVEALLEQVNRAKERLDRVPLILRRFRQAVLTAACSGELTREWRAGRLSPSVAPSLAMLLEKRRSLWEKRNGSTKNTRRYPEPFEPLVPHEFDLPDDWTWVTASHLALLDVGFAFKSAEFTDHGVRLLRGENVEPGSLRWAETRCWPEDRLDEVRHLLVEPGEIILALDRPIVSAGLKIALVKPSDIPALLVQRVMRFKMVQPTNTDYLYLCLSQQRFIDFVAHEGMTGSDLPHITGTGVAEFPIPLPPTDEQREIVRRANALFAFADTIERRLRAATTCTEKLPQSILSKAFSGELVPTEAELARTGGRTYETAAELLTRVTSAPKGGRMRERGRVRSRFDSGG
jgi:type I restriction enzyme S subunit